MAGHPWDVHSRILVPRLGGWAPTLTSPHRLLQESFYFLNVQGRSLRRNVVLPPPNAANMLPTSLGSLALTSMLSGILWPHAIPGNPGTPGKPDGP